MPKGMMIQNLMVFWNHFFYLLLSCWQTFDKKYSGIIESLVWISRKYYFPVFYFYGSEFNSGTISLSMMPSILVKNRRNKFCDSRIFWYTRNYKHQAIFSSPENGIKPDVATVGDNAILHLRHFHPFRVFSLFRLINSASKNHAATSVQRWLRPPQAWRNNTRWHASLLDLKTAGFLQTRCREPNKSERLSPA